MDISLYTSYSNRYICPTDGYVVVITNNSQSGRMIIADTAIAQTVPANSYTSMFVKKGFDLYIDGTFTNAYFRKIGV